LQSNSAPAAKGFLDSKEYSPKEFEKINSEYKPSSLISDSAKTPILDKDAQEIALYYTVQFQNQGISTRNIIPSDKDAVEMVFSKVNKILKESTETNFDDVIKQKLFNL
jgi:hypothetical protein